MNRTTFILLLLVSLLPLACATKKSEVATRLGYKKSIKVQAGPYQLHYAKDGTDEFLALFKNDRDVVFSRYTGEGTDVGLNGLSTIHFNQKPDGSLTNLSLNFCDAEGKETTSFIDRDADGQWDMKIDYVQKRVSTWKDGQWIEHPSWAQATNAPASISH